MTFVAGIRGNTRTLSSVFERSTDITERTGTNVLDLIGHTPMVRLKKLEEAGAAQVWAKLESFNPGGSVKDRAASAMVDSAERSGALKPGMTIVEPTSGNTGMGLAMVAAIRGYKTVFVMPDKMSEEKIASLRAFGARVVVTPTNVGPDDPRSYYRVAEQIVHDTPGAILANQYHNPSNPKAHELSTGPEIWDQTQGEVDVFIASMGTGGTITGIARYLKKKNPNIQIIGIDPVGSIYYDYFYTGKIVPAHSYEVEGFGEDFLPTTMDLSTLDGVVRVTDRECFLMARRLVREEGLFCGGSCGGIIAGAIKWAEQNDGPKNIVTILPDGASRYLSKIFDDAWMQERSYLQPELNATISDILHNQNAKVITASPQDSIQNVTASMKSHGISQLPIVDGSRLLGLATEAALLQALIDGNTDLSTPVSELVDMNFAVVEPTNSVGLLPQIFGQNKVAVVLNGSSVAGIVTKIDFLEFYTRAQL